MANRAIEVLDNPKFISWIKQTTIDLCDKLEYVCKNSLFAEYAGQIMSKRNQLTGMGRDLIAIVRSVTRPNVLALVEAINKKAKYYIWAFSS